MKATVLLTVAVALLLSLQHSVSQSVPAIGGDLAEIALSGEGGVGGWTFFVQEPIRVTGFGWYDNEADGLFSAMQVSLWRDNSGKTTNSVFIDPSTATLVALGTVPKGIEARLAGPWRVVDFDLSLTLEPGGYEIASTNLGDGKDLHKYYLANTDPFSPQVDSRILLGVPASGASMPPDELLLTYGAFLGPMFFIEVPEPTGPSLILLALSTVLARCQLLRRQRGIRRREKRTNTSP